jgi:hypothetical protein
MTLEEGLVIDYNKSPLKIIVAFSKMVAGPASWMSGKHLFSA